MSRFRMCRWHKNCVNPDFEIIDKDGYKVPRCRACHETPPIEAFVDQLGQRWRPNPIPIDEGLGLMNLHWPASVFQNQNVAPPPNTTQAQSNRTVGVNINGQRQTFQMVDEEQLNSSKLRLMRLSPVTGDDPVCVSLQTCTDDNIPEYEALSYSLGGNNRRTDPNKPVYIGEHRDVMILTETCESMLRFLSPHPGEQAGLVWFDYLCINQNDMIERDYQLPKMRSIYSGCTRVIVYLGTEIADKLGPGQHRPRRWLHEIDDVFRSHNQPLTLEDIFRNNYFQRTWVIQEILLAETIVIPIRNYDFRAGLVALNRLENVRTLNWDQTGAPWLRHMGQTTIYGGNLYEALRQTWASNVTDRRDKVFGILGLVDDSDFRANSNLSWISTFIGTCAHLIKRGNTELLLKSMGNAALADQLSWLPDIRNNAIWRPRDRSPLESINGIRNQYPLYHGPRLHSNELSWDEISRHQERIQSALTYNIDVICMRTSMVEDLLPNLDQFSVHKSTGALCLDMGHLLTVPSRRIQKIAEQGNLKAFEIREDGNFLIITTLDGPLETLQSSDDIFLRLDEYNRFGILFTLRRQGKNGPYKLIFTCVCIDILLVTEHTFLRNDYKKGIPTSPRKYFPPTPILYSRYNWFRSIFARNVLSLRDECSLVNNMRRIAGDPDDERIVPLHPAVFPHPLERNDTFDGFLTEPFLQQWNIQPNSPNQSFPQFEWPCKQEIVNALGLQGQVRSVQIQ